MDLILKKDASNFRDKHGISATEPIRLKSLLQKLNILTFFTPMSGDFSGMALYFNKGANKDMRFMMVNSNHSLGKQHFTICHELYHLFIEKGFTSRTCVTGKFNKRDKIEFFADVFAAHLLMPEAGIIQQIPDEELNGINKIKLETILGIEQYYSCSRTALLYRLQELKLITWEYGDQFRTSDSKAKAAQQYGYSKSLYVNGNENLIIGDYGQLAKSLYDDNKISEGHYLSLMKDIGIDLLIPVNVETADE